MTREKTFDRLIAHTEFVKNRLESSNMARMVTCLQGSQNYGLADEFSDVDTKSILLPSFQALVFNTKQISQTWVLSNEEHADVKDIRLMFNNFRKQNINFLEILFTPFYLADHSHLADWIMLREHREKIAHYNIYLAVSCMAGMAYEKYHAFEHPYPAAVEKIRKFGYDPKQLHHLLRMEEFLNRYLKGESFEDCLIPLDIDHMLQIKRGSIPYEKAVVVRDEAMKRVESVAKRWKSSHNKVVVDKEVDDILDGIVYKMLKNKIKEELE